MPKTITVTTEYYSDLYDALINAAPYDTIEILHDVYNYNGMKDFTWRTANISHHITIIGNDKRIGKQNEPSTYLTAPLLGATGDDPIQDIIINDLELNLNIYVNASNDDPQAFNCGGIVTCAQDAAFNHCTTNGRIVHTDSIIRYGFGRCIGGLAGNLLGDCQMKLCANTAEISGGGTYVGGLVGFHRASYGKGMDHSLLIDSCANTGHITGRSCVGGIAGAVQPYGANPTNALIIDSVNSGHIYVFNNNAGGILGKATGSVVQNCVNHGSIICKQSFPPIKTDERYGHIGGITGDVTDCLILSCRNKGGITGMASSVNQGGITGRIECGTIYGCVNEAGIVNGGFAGGIVGSAVGNKKSDPAIVDHCENYGDVSGTQNAVGGISGGAYGYVNIIGCIAHKSINKVSTMAQGCGGIVGAVMFDPAITDIHTVGEVKIQNNEADIHEVSVMPDIKDNIGRDAVHRILGLYKPDLENSTIKLSENKADYEMLLTGNNTKTYVLSNDGVTSASYGTVYTESRVSLEDPDYGMDRLNGASDSYSMTKP